eukprot:scaffold156411_cov26-Tisochrysis_lutea.AAC.1
MHTLDAPVQHGKYQRGAGHRIAWVVHPQADVGPQERCHARLVAVLGCHHQAVQVLFAHSVRLA